jgi:hypothetical protein
MDAIDALLAGIEPGAIPAGVFGDDVVLDATVPNWRYTTRGCPAVGEVLSHWYADPGTFENLRRTPIAEGELVEFTLTSEENGIAHMGHQAHILRLRDGHVASDTAFCWRRWPAPLIAEMAAASQTAG